MGKKTEKGRGPEIDEHDLPTEPVPYIPATPDMNATPSVPQQQPITLGPFQQNPSYPALPNAPKFDVYPYHPPLAPQQAQVSPQPAIKTPVAHSSKRPLYLSFIPICIGLFFVCIQLLLLTRFVLRLLGIAEGAAWVSTVYALCDIALLPFQALLPPLQLPGILNTRVELYTLLAVLVYGILSRIIVRILKIILRTPQLVVPQSKGQVGQANPSQTRPGHPGY